MSVISSLLNSPLLLRKGEGIFRVDPETGESVYIGMPHEGIFHDDEKNPLHYGIDLPLHAHLGDRTPSGQWMQGKHGEMVWQDEYGHTHRHGIDGLINQLGELGVPDPHDFIQEVIDYVNKNHTNDAMKIPSIEDAAWRKLVAHNYSKSFKPEEALSYPYNGKDGTFATLNMSSNPEASTAKFKLAQHPESYRLGFAPIIRQMLGEKYGIDIPEGQYIEGITKSYISGEALSPKAKRLKGSFGEALTPQGLLPHHVNEALGVTGNQVQPFQEAVHSWEMYHALPAILAHPDAQQIFKEFEGKRAGGRPFSPVIYEKALAKFAPHMLAKTPPELLDTPIITSTSGQMSLREVLQDETGIKILAGQMMKSPAALAFLLGNADQAGAANHILDEMHSQLLSQLSPEEAKALDNTMMGITAGKTPGAQDRNSHEMGKKLFGLAHHVEPESMKEFALEHFPPHPDLEAQDGLFNLVADSISHAHGHQPRRATTEAPDYSNVTLPRLLDQNMGTVPLPPYLAERKIKEWRQYPEGVDGPESDEELKPLAPPSGDSDIWNRIANYSPETQAQIYEHFKTQNPQHAIDESSLQTQALQSGQEFTPQMAAQRFINAQRQKSETTQQTLPDYPVAASFDTIPVEDRLIKAMERLQMLDAKKDVAVLKRVSTVPSGTTDSHSFLADKMGLEKQDIRAIAHSKGDWNRVAKAYNTKPVLVKAVKVSLEGQ
jgi:hypothetical protein